MEFSNIFTIKKEVTEQQFLRNVLISLSKDEKSPANIMDATFGKVVESNVEFLLVSTDIEVSYSGSCGYDRQEEYKTTESKYVSEGDYYTCNGVTKRATRSGSVQVDTIKTRTVTDWRPHSGIVNTHEAGVVVNSDNEDEKLESLFLQVYKQIKSDSVAEEGNAVVNYSAYKSAINWCETSARFSVDWPGDRQRDQRYNFMTDVKSIQCFIVPCYTVEFLYIGKKYTAKGLAVGEVNEIHETPNPDGKVESIEIIENRRKANVEVAEKPLKVKRGFIVLAVIMGIVGLYGLMNISQVGVGAEVCLPLGFILMTVSIIIAVIINKKVNRAVDEVNSKAEIEKRNLNNIKTDKLVVKLKKMNLPALSTQEKNGISATDYYK